MTSYLLNLNTPSLTKRQDGHARPIYPPLFSDLDAVAETILFNLSRCGKGLRRPLAEYLRTHLVNGKVEITDEQISLLAARGRNLKEKGVAA